MATTRFKMREAKDIDIIKWAREDRLGRIKTSDDLSLMREYFEKHYSEYRNRFIESDMESEEAIERFLKVLRSIGSTGKKLSEKLESGDAADYSELIAYATLYDIVLPLLDEYKRKPPALSLGAMEGIDSFFQGTRIENGRNDGEHRTSTIVDRNGCIVADISSTDLRGVPAMEIKAVKELLDKGVRLLGSIYAHRLIRWEVKTVHKQNIDNDMEARIIRIEGGWEGLAERIGIAQSKGYLLHRLVVIQAHACWKWPDGTYGNLLSYSMRPSAPGRLAMLKLTIGDLLVPQYVQRLERHRRERMLVPIVDLPPFIGRKNDQGLQANFQMRVMNRIRVNARELVDEKCCGGVHFASDIVEELASPLRKDLVWKVWQRWQRDGDDGPAFLRKVDKDHYRLGSAHKRAEAMLIEAGRIELRAMSAGKESVAKRRKKGWKKQRHPV